MESFFNSLKNERVHGTRYATRREAKDDIFEYIEAFYNRKRLHSTLAYVAPQTYLQNWDQLSTRKRTRGIMSRRWKTKNSGGLNRLRRRRKR